MLNIPILTSVLRRLMGLILIKNYTSLISFMVKKKLFGICLSPSIFLSGLRSKATLALQDNAIDFLSCLSKSWKHPYWNLFNP